MNARYVAWLVVGTTALPCLAFGDTPTPAPIAAAGSTPVADVSTPATPVAPEIPTVIMPAAAGPADATTTPPTTVAALPDPVPGDSVAGVLAALGKPNGVINMPDKYLMMFDRGNVVMSLQDVVMETKLMPLAGYTAKLAEQVAEENDRRTAKARVNALLDLLLNDPSYIAMSTRDRLLALTRFDREHPGSDAHQNYLDLLAVYAAEQSTTAKVADYQNQAADARAQALFAQQQAASIEEQLKQAQQQAALAQQQAATAQRQAANPQQTNNNTVVGGVTVVSGGGPIVRAGNGGIVITGGAGLNSRQPQPMIINNNSITNVPPQGVRIVMPDGSIKFIPGSASGNHTVYF
jgi:hypothetical protein